MVKSGVPTCEVDFSMAREQLCLDFLFSVTNDLDGSQWELGLAYRNCWERLHCLDD